MKEMKIGYNISHEGVITSYPKIPGMCMTIIRICTDWQRLLTIPVDCND